MNARVAAMFQGIWILLAAFVVQAPSMPPLQAAEPIPLVFVVNRSNPVDTLTVQEVRMMLLGERSHWPDGSRITVVMREPNQPERDAVLQLVCKLDDRVYTRTILRAVFTGELRSVPKLLDTSAGVLRFIYNVPGAIGYVRASEVNQTVKIARLSAAAPGEAYGFTLKTP
jgi:ABC-type phosphate transport system substrate-binding protein